MKYQANPVIVDAYQIVEIGERLTAPKRAFNRDGSAVVIQAGSMWLRLDSGKAIWTTPEQLARITPELGDYVVVQEDGYTYLNPKDVFERKYSPVEDECHRRQ